MYSNVHDESSWGGDIRGKENTVERESAGREIGGSVCVSTVVLPETL